MVFITAEIGINHNGDIDIAKKLIDLTVIAGCNAVKFQKRNIDKVYTKKFLDSDRESPWGTTQKDQKIHLEFGKEGYDEIDKYCFLNDIEWYASSWDVDSQLFLRQYDLKHNKVASAMLVHTKLLETIAKEKKYTFISTGMSTMEEIRKAVDIFRNNNCPFELLHSNSSYPMNLEEANLKVIPMLKKKFKCNVGYSGHEVGATNVSIPAILMGATSLERHITLDRSMYGSDQASSLEPAGLTRLVRDVRLLDKILGDGKKRIWKSEIPARKKLREVLT